MDTKALRQKILDLAIRGKLVPQDSNDEPASVLLERIREKKRQMVKEGKLKAKDIKNDTVIFKGDDNLHYEKFSDGSVKCIEEEIPFELPDGWEWARLASLCIINPKNKIDDDMKVSFVPMSLINDGFSGKHTYEIRSWKQVKTGFTHFMNDDIGIAKITPCFENRKSVIFDDLINGYGAGTTELYILRAFPDIIISKYLLWITKTENFIKGGVQTYTGAVGQQRVEKEYISQYLIPVPPLYEQHKITKKIDSVFLQISLIEVYKNRLQEIILQTKVKILDLAISGQLVPQDPNDEPASVLLERIRENKEELIKSGKLKRDKKESVIFKGDDNSYYAMIDGSPINISEHLRFELPSGWSWITLSDIACVTSGKTPKPEQISDCGDVPYFKVSDMNTQGNELYLQYTDSYVNNLYSGPIFEEGSFVFPKNGGAVLTNKKRILTQTSVVDLNTGVFTTSCLLNPDFAFYLFTSIDFSKIHKGAVIPTVDSSVIGNLIYGLPPIEEQKRIAATIKTIFLNLSQIKNASS